jgi:hypothetical protein
VAGLSGLLGKKPAAFVPPPGSYLLGVGKQRFVGRLDRVWLKPSLAASHALVVGQTGSGKTKLIESLCRQFIAGGQGFCLLDLHGDLAGELARFGATLPAQQRERFTRSLVWLDAADPERTVTFNPLAAGSRGDAATQRLELLAAFRRHWSDSWGPRLADLLTHTLAVLQANGLTLAEVPVFLGDKEVRAKLLGHRDVEPASRDYFWMRFNPLPKRDQVMMSESTMNKVGALLADYRVRTLIGDTHPTLDPRRAIEEQQVVLARIPRGALVENADLLGSLLLAAFHTAALSRVALSPERRRPYVIVLDEAQIASETFPQLLAGARAFGLAAVCGIQYLDLVPAPLAEALLSNCRVRICFRTSRRDGERLSRELLRADGDHVKFQEHDLLGSRKSKPMYWSVPEEWEYGIRELQDQGTGECVIQLGRELPWFAETVAIEAARPDPDALQALGRRAASRRRRRAEVSRGIEARRHQLTQQEVTHRKGGDDHDGEDDAIETIAEV